MTLSLALTIVAASVTVGLAVWALTAPSQAEQVSARRRAIDALAALHDQVELPAPTWLAELDPASPSRDRWERLARTRTLLEEDLPA